MANLLKVIVIVTVTLHTVHPLSIEHPQSYSLFKRGLVLGDVTYSYASTDMGAPNGGRVKTVTVIKNMSLPKPTSTMFSDRTEQFFETFDLTGNKKREEVQYWPADERNKMKKIATKPPSFTIPKTVPKSIPKTNEFPQEDFKHPVDLLEIVKSAAKTQSKILKNLPGGGDTGPVMFPPDAQMGKKRNNGVISVAKDYTSVLTTDAKERSKPKTASKLSTKVETPKMKRPESYNSFDPSSMYEEDFEQTEYVYSPETNSYTLKQTSKPTAEVRDKIKNTPYAYKDPAPPSTIDITLYSAKDNETTPDLLFSELANAVSSRNITMIKSLAGLLDEPYDFPKYEFESLKTDENVPISYDFTSSANQTPEPESSTVDTDGKLEVSDNLTTTVEAPTTTKKPSKYIAPRLRGFKRFSSRKQ